MSPPPTPRYGAAGIEHVAIEGMELLGKATWKVKPRWVAASEVGSERVSIARVDGNAARVAGTSTGSASDQRKGAMGSAE
jgi:hypothetical protein